MTTSRNAFDFNIGEWLVINRCLKQRGAGCTDWDVFEHSQTSQLLLGGMCSLDEADFVTRGSKGMTYRLYSPARDEWTIWWVTDRDGELGAPVKGRFEGTRGTFRGDDMDGDRPVQVVFDWQADDPQAPRWSQAFSYDGGETWETNWIMEFRRR